MSNSNSSEEEIIALYLDFGNAKKVAAALRVSHKRVLRIAREAGVLHPRGKRRCDELWRDTGFHFYGGSWWYHHGRQRYKSEERVCPCGKKFPARPFLRSKFCSRSCSAVGRSHCKDVGSVFILRSSGYAYEKVGVTDPMRNMGSKESWVLQHRLAVARQLGRPLRDDESVHHINGDRADNRFENLQLRVRFHGNGQVACCDDCGSKNISFKSI